MHKFSIAQKAYLTQYISLMLIILSCLIAASANRHKVAHSEVSTLIEERPRLLKNDFLKSEIVFENIFDEHSGAIDAYRLEALKEILEAHQLDLTLELLTDQGVATKVAHLSKVLREQGFWKDSFIVSGSTRVIESAQDQQRLVPGTRVVAHFQRSHS